jgi:hypothetical protein
MSDRDSVAISRRTIALRRKAQEYGGQCDGWESPVVKGLLHR